jgi:hypothetical protein
MYHRHKLLDPIETFSLSRIAVQSRTADISKYAETLVSEIFNRVDG